MTELLTLRTDTTIGGDSVHVHADIEASGATPSGRPRRVPFFIPRSQAYYWSYEWQEGEAEADEELGRGEIQTFDDPLEALRWLDSPED